MLVRILNSWRMSKRAAKKISQKKIYSRKHSHEYVRVRLLLVEVAQSQSGSSNHNANRDASAQIITEY